LSGRAGYVSVVVLKPLFEKRFVSFETTRETFLARPDNCRAAKHKGAGTHCCRCPDRNVPFICNSRRTNLQRQWTALKYSPPFQPARIARRSPSPYNHRGEKEGCQRQAIERVGERRAPQSAERSAQRSLLSPACTPPSRRCGSCTACTADAQSVHPSFPYLPAKPGIAPQCCAEPANQQRWAGSRALPAPKYKEILVHQKSQVLCNERLLLLWRNLRLLDSNKV
jgi:hypothetical protein